MDRKLLARLLSGRNEPSVLEKEAILERIVTTNGLRRKRPRAFTALVALFTSMAAAGATALVVHVRHAPTSDEFASRGRPAANPTVRLACLEAPTAGTCRLGDTLAFEVDGWPADKPHLAAFARRADGTVIWYFPGADGRSEPIETTRGLLKRAVRLGPPHVPGPYQVIVVLSRAPMTRADIRKALEGSPAPNGILVIERPMLLEGGV